MYPSLPGSLNVDDQRSSGRNTRWEPESRGPELDHWGAVKHLRKTAEQNSQTLGGGRPTQYLIGEADGH